MQVYYARILLRKDPCTCMDASVIACAFVRRHSGYFFAYSGPKMYI